MGPEAKAPLRANDICRPCLHLCRWCVQLCNCQRELCVCLCGEGVREELRPKSQQSSPFVIPSPRRFWGFKVSNIKCMPSVLSVPLCAAYLLTFCGGAHMTFGTPPEQDLERDRGRRVWVALYWVQSMHSMPLMPPHVLCASHASPCTPCTTHVYLMPCRLWRGCRRPPSCPP